MPYQMDGRTMHGEGLIRGYFCKCDLTLNHMIVDIVGTTT